VFVALFSLLRKENTPKSYEPPISETTQTVVAEKTNLEKVKLIRVVDGDTVIVRKEDGNNVRVRLIGIDTPESVNPDNSKNTVSGKAASAFLKSKMEAGKDYFLEYDVEREDKYGRTLAYLWDTDHTQSDKEYIVSHMVNAMLINEGYATTMQIDPNVEYSKVFDEIKDDAKENKKELWTAKDTHWS
jgi:micrococcal nuclease